MRLHTAFCAALFDADAPCPTGLKTWNGSDPALRFAVHRNNVVVSLVDALAATFPVCCALTGPEFFRAMARSFVTRRPPRSRRLVDYGDGFADFIATFRPADPVPYLADMARLERLCLAATHAADAAAIAPTTFTALLARPDRLAAARLRLQPALAILPSRFAVADLWAAHQGALELADVEPYRPQQALVVRHGLQTKVLRLPAATAAFVNRLRAGETLADAAAAAGTRLDLAAALATLLRHDAIVGLDLPEEEHAPPP